MENLRIFLICCLFVFAVSCSSVYDVSYDYDQQVNFASLKTYDWLSVPEGVSIDSLVLNRIMTAVSNNLNNKGFRMTSDNPDFLIAMHAGTKEKVSYRDWGYSYGGYWRGPRHSSFRYEEGTLVLDFVDAKSKELIWRGVAKGFVGSAKTPEETDKLVNEFVQEILKKFPPPPSK
jgi:hypothetical protein